MNHRPPPITIREFRSGDEPTLREVFFTSIRNRAAGEYNIDHLTAWAPESYDCGLGANRRRVPHPFVAEWEGRVVGCADFQGGGGEALRFKRTPPGGRLEEKPACALTHAEPQP
jgi:hypothetical protein